MTSFDWNHLQIKEFFDCLRLKSVSEETIKTYTHTRFSNSTAKDIALSIPNVADSLEKAGKKALGIKNSRGKYEEELNDWSEFASNVLEYFDSFHHLRLGNDR